MKKMFIVMMLVLSFSVFSNDQIKRFDIGMYSPLDVGLKDLVLNLKTPQLSNAVREKFTMLKNTSLSYKVYWSFPEKYFVDVHGLPEGFKDLKNELRLAVIDKIEYIIPIKLTQKLKGYDLKEQNESGVKKVIAEDKTGKMEVNRLELTFNRTGQLEQIDAFGTRGANKTIFQYSLTDTNKWLVTKIENIIERGNVKHITENSILYVKNSGYYFPERLTSKTIQESITKEKKNRAELSSTEYIFDSFEVNTGKAQKFISHGPVK